PWWRGRSPSPPAPGGPPRNRARSACGAAPRPPTPGRRRNRPASRRRSAGDRGPASFVPLLVPSGTAQPPHPVEILLPHPEPAEGEGIEQAQPQEGDGDEDEDHQRRG